MSMRCRRLVHEQSRVGPLSCAVPRFLTQESTTDIVVNRPGEIGVKAGGTWSWHDETFLTYQPVDEVGAGLIRWLSDADDG